LSLTFHQSRSWLPIIYPTSIDSQSSSILATQPSAKKLYPSAIFHVPFGDEPLKGLDGYLQILGMMRGAFPDIQWTLQETVCEGDKIVARFETRGTHQGPFLGVPASGKAIRITAINIYRFADGKIVEERGQPDIFGLIVQIGAIPGPSP
jgi:steroid delta-isomerase-like uncharacterized protein